MFNHFVKIECMLPADTSTEGVQNFLLQYVQIQKQSILSDKLKGELCGIVNLIVI